MSTPHRRDAEPPKDVRDIRNAAEEHLFRASALAHVLHVLTWQYEVQWNTSEKFILWDLEPDDLRITLEILADELDQAHAVLSDLARRNSKEMARRMRARAASPSAERPTQISADPRPTGALTLAFLGRSDTLTERLTQAIARGTIFFHCDEDACGWVGEQPQQDPQDWSIVSCPTCAAHVHMHNPGEASCYIKSGET